MSATMKFTAGEQSRGYIRQHVQLNLKKLVVWAICTTNRCRSTGRSVYGVRADGKGGVTIAASVSGPFLAATPGGLLDKGAAGASACDGHHPLSQRMERYWNSQIRYIY